jgi:hypothetical protein
MNSPEQKAIGGDFHPRPTIRLRFVGFWDGFDPADNFFTRLLEPHWHIDQDSDPDFILYTTVGSRRKDFLAYDCTRIFFTGENVRADWLNCDWAFTFRYEDHPRHLRLPLWVLYADPHRLVKPPAIDTDAILEGKTRFCGFVVSNPLCRTRNDFFHKLSRYRPVASGGKLFNNVGGRVADKRAFLAECRFTIAFENESSPGYTTEKVLEPMLVNSIPIYWGDPLVGRDFDTTSFLSAHDSPSLDDLVERVVAVDRDPFLLEKMLRRPWLPGNRVPSCADSGRILGQFNRIFAEPVSPVARRRGVARSLRLHRLPAAFASIGHRMKRQARKKQGGSRLFSPTRASRPKL